MSTFCLIQISNTCLIFWVGFYSIFTEIRHRGPVLSKVGFRVGVRWREEARKNRVLYQPLLRILCNAVIQLYFDPECLTCYSHINNSLKTKLQTFQTECLRFCLNLNNRAHIGLNKFGKINWLPKYNYFEWCITSTTSNFLNKRSPVYINDIFKPTGHPSTNTRVYFRKLNQPLRKINNGKKNVFIFTTIYLKKPGKFFESN